MTRRALHALCLLLVAGCARTPEPSAPAAQANGFSGVAISAKGRRIIHAQALGVADPATARALGLDDRWRWASITKAIVAVLVMQEVEAGRLALDDRLGGILPAFASTPAGNATIRQLLTHRSGLANPDRSPPDAAGAPGYYSRDAETRAANADYCDGPPEAAPGARFDYNNCDYIVLGRILEAVTGRSWTALFDERIAAVAGMTDTGVVGRDLEETVMQLPADAALPLAVDAYGAAGALGGPPRDLLMFNAALMDGGLLGRSALDVLWTPDPADGFAALGVWVYAAPLAGCEAPIRLVERRGGIGAIQTLNLLAPDRNRSLIVFTNDAGVSLGDIWTGGGLAFDLASAAFCEVIP